MKLDVRGIIPPMVTPFTWEGEDLDVGAIRDETEHLIQSGIHGLCAGGSTGEGEGLSEQEVYRLCRAVVEQARDRVPVIGGIIADSTAEAIRKSRAAKEAGVMALQVTPPHYLWTPDAETLARYYQEIGDAVQLPIVIYNVVPWVNIDIRTIRRLADVTWLAGIKQSGGDLHKVADLMHEFHDRLTVITAVDDLLYLSYCLGVDGAICCLNTVLPGPTLEMWNRMEAGDHAGAKALHDRILPVWRAIEGVNMPYLAKVAIELQGRKVGPARSPMLPPSQEKRAEIRQRLVEAGIAVVA